MTERPFSPPIDVTRPYFAEHLLTPEMPRFSTVMSLAIIDRNTTENGLIVPSTRILAGVRDPKTNPTDPDVISIPTRTIDPEVAQTMIRHYNIDSIEEKATEGNDPKVEVRWKRKPLLSQNFLPQVTSLFRDKLGVADALADQSLTITNADLEVSVFGKVYGTDADPENGEEMLHMLGVRVDVDFAQDTSPFPDATNLYYGIQFMRVDEFTQLVDQKDPFLISRFGDFSKVCVRGLCVQAGRNIINK